MDNTISIDEIVRHHGTGKIKMLDSFSEANNVYFEHDYTCKILDDLGNHVIRISMPTHYGSTVSLPLDSHYEMIIETDIGNYYSKGTIINRYRNEEGNVMDYKLTRPLSYLKPLKFPEVKTNIQADYTLHDSTVKNIGNIVLLSMEYMRLMTNELLNESDRLDIVFSLDGGESFVVSGIVKEVIRVDVNQYENYIIFENLDFVMSEAIVKWLIKN